MQKTTLFLVLVALGLGGYVYWYEMKPHSQQETVEESEQGLFSFTEKEVQRLTIKRGKGNTLEFVRLETDDSSWRMKQPEGRPAEEGAIVFLLDLLVKESNPKTFEVETDKLQTYGLTNPSTTINLELTDNTTHRIILGKPTFDQEDIYAQIDPQDTEKTQVYVLPINFQNAVERPLSEWKLALPSESEETPSSENESNPSLTEEEEATQTEETESNPSSTEEEE